MRCGGERKRRLSSAGYRVLDTLSIVTCLLSPDNVHMHKRSALFSFPLLLLPFFSPSCSAFWWEMLRNTVNKTIGRVASLQVSNAAGGGAGASCKQKELATAEKARREGPYDEDDEKSPEADRCACFARSLPRPDSARVRAIRTAIGAAGKDVSELFLDIMQRFM